MRDNGPVTNREYVLDDHDRIVSKTDIHGNITYVNQDFIDISGYTREELIGAPQNIVRHPDMPRAAFEDFWRTLKAGKAWTGLVKNRRKDGDHYWVEANAAPLLEDGQVVGYTSIRIKPGREQVEAAERAYARIREGDRSLAIREGAVVTRSPWRRLEALAGCSLRTKLMLFALAGMLLSVTALVCAVQDWDNLMKGTAAAGLALSIMGWYLLHQSTVTPLEQVKHGLNQMSAGDLTGRVSARGSREMADALQALRILQINIKLLVGQIKEASTSVNLGAGEIAGNNSDLSERTESQASSLQQTAASMEQLTGVVRQNAEHAHDAHALAASATTVAGEGGMAMAEVSATMTAIRHSASRIADITGVIDGIAFQTNILALNAAVEAARAGEHGRGFAVVAAEVRALAHRSATAAKEIKALIEESIAHVGQGGAIVERAGSVMENIVATVAQVSDHVGNIRTASAEQRDGIEQVNIAVVKMDEITQRNAALVEEAAAVAEHLRQQAGHMDMLVSHFRLTAGSGATRA
jgi:aerotaxis receptor